ncbi:twin-arginine translocation signal domain-containing protein [candidate division KSB1 bacterium]|nr:twin-arginine translocation signal domain-containing protein [candidate division KSB1 bacterium]
MKQPNFSRRDFLKTSSTAGLTLSAIAANASETKLNVHSEMIKNQTVPTLDLTPAKWIWYPSERCLQNSFIFFRKKIFISNGLKSAKGWIVADSRYKLMLNGERIQWGPAPSDPRWVDVDPVDLMEKLKIGENYLAVQVLFYGQGDGTWPIGKPGLIFKLEVEYIAGDKQLFVSDITWQTCLARCWPPGQYKRWYLRSLQEIFDARLYPAGWENGNEITQIKWLPAMELSCPADKPALCSNYRDYLFEIGSDCENASLRPRRIPFMDEIVVSARDLVESHYISWKVPADDYFDFLLPDAFQAVRESCVLQHAGKWQILPRPELSAVLTFEFTEQIVGWPGFTVQAEEGTIIELLVQEAHQPGGPAVMNNHFFSWTRFVCKQGENVFETFDYESLRWIQLVVRNTNQPVFVSNVQVRRRRFPWPNEPALYCSDGKIQKLLNAAINTIHNAAQETIVDGMGRERQQYSGDVGHQLHAIFLTFGEKRLPARYLETFSQGLTHDGYFLDCWPAYDRLARLMERQMDLTPWGPLLDHGIGFNFDSYYYYLYTGDRSALTEVFPRLCVFYHYLKSIQTSHGLLPVENTGVPKVWIDHNAYLKQRHKQCAFNLYTVAMLYHAFRPLCSLFGRTDLADEAYDFAGRILRKTQQFFWSSRHGLYVNNLPWIAEEKNIRTCDRSLATAVLFDLCPDGNMRSVVDTLAECPPHMGFSYPANAGWRLWALAKARRIQSVLNDFRTRWAFMQSVDLNNTLQEDWTARPDSQSQWSHCPVAPLYVFFMNVAGIQPLEPGFRKFFIRPQPGDLNEMKVTAHTVRGAITVDCRGTVGHRIVKLCTPKDTTGLLVLDGREILDLPENNETVFSGEKHYILPAGEPFEVNLEYS